MIKVIYDINLINSLLKEFNVSINEIGVFSHYNIYVLDNRIFGFLNYDLIYDRIEINYIYVNESCRREGIASKLLDNLLEIAKVNKCNNITLEVRNSNKGAIEFYNKNSFKMVAKRDRYYGDEDGILMIRELV